MRTLGRATTALLRFVQQLNLFNTYSTDARQIRKEILSTRIYIALLPTILIILFIYSAQTELYYTVKVNNPSLDTYERLLNAYPNTLSCPCSELSIPYSSFVTLTPVFHPVCSSDFVSDRWLAYLYHEDASSYVSADIRSVGNAQFQLLRTLCESSKQAIANAFQSTFTSQALINSHGLIQSSDLVHVAAEVFARDFISDIDGKQRRRNALLTTIFDRNFPVSGLETSSIPIIDSTLNLNIVIVKYFDWHTQGEVTTFQSCTCDTTYTCQTPLGICNSSGYEADYTALSAPIFLPTTCSKMIDGFRSGCLPLNGLLSSTLQCYNEQTCFDSILGNLSIVNSSFNILDRNVLKQSVTTSAISALADVLMVEEWSRYINYSLYFTTCRLLSCSYSYTTQFDKLYIITTLVGLLGGLIAALRFLCPHIAHGFYQMQDRILLRRQNRATGHLPLGKGILLSAIRASKYCAFHSFARCHCNLTLRQSSY